MWVSHGGHSTAVHSHHWISPLDRGQMDWATGYGTSGGYGAAPSRQMCSSADYTSVHRGLLHIPTRAGSHVRQSPQPRPVHLGWGAGTHTSSGTCSCRRLNRCMMYSTSRTGSSGYKSAGPCSGISSSRLVDCSLSIPLHPPIRPRECTLLPSRYPPGGFYPTE